MCPEELSQQIQLIFAQACADALKNNADALLGLKDGEVEQVAKAHGEAFASAFVFVARHFIGQLPYSDRATPLVDMSLDGPLVQREKTARAVAEAVSAAERYT
ncbi:hypothetical protein D9M71_371330 [compost metagenome]